MEQINLHVGDIIKNYKVLCEMLQQPVKAGKSRTLQLKDFKRYFDGKNRARNLSLLMYTTLRYQKMINVSLETIEDTIQTVMIHIK